ncbi:hypothetical protein H9M94_00240 [Mycoplasma sp. Pen4]|uniref:hypothetical protein n=1 Tax=Mycoplasma sp. Pen4 TaxID=640330 RepID=UPI0016547E3C|nr:hypothetical protein [Mycoplasma sp. Pen4]QNM93696.1 hypothetical protein H9M94_00240 [Mycoplasma sp. Pen4]
MNKENNVLKKILENIKNAKFVLGLEGYDKHEIDVFMQQMYLDLYQVSERLEMVENELEQFKNLYKEQLDDNNVLKEENKRLSREVAKIYE